jgi:polar amino acid transport system substrate-binding protein
MKILCALFLFICSSLVAQAEPLKVCSNEWPPYTFLQDGEVRGIDADTMKLALDNLGIPFEIALEPWRRCLYRMQHGTLDILLDAFYNEERAKLMFYVPTPMADTEMVLFYAKTRPHLVSSAKELTGLRVGTEPGYEYNDKEFAHGTHFIREDAPTVESNLGKLALGRIDLVLTDRAVGLFTATTMGIQDTLAYNEKPLYNDNVYILFRRTPALAEVVPRFDAELKRIKASPEYQEILRRYHQLPASSTSSEHTETRTE